jgi:hypothetical protein
MKPATKTASEPSVLDRPKPIQFRNKFNAPKLSRDDARRQGLITHLAFSLLDGRDPALAFLNGVHAGLGGRPIDLAIGSDDGYAKVEQALRERASAGDAR